MYMLVVKLRYFLHGMDCINFPFQSADVADIAGKTMMFSENVIGYKVLNVEDGVEVFVSP